MAKLENMNLIEGLDFNSSEDMPVANTIINIPISQIRDYHNHTFYVLDDESMVELTDSVKKFGILEPLMVREIGNNEYELISGHRRKMACEKAGIRTVPAIVKELENDDADILMVDSNLYREYISLTEKVKSYRVKYEAIKNKTGSALEELAEESKLSLTQAYRYLRLSFLTDDLLEKIENKKITIDAGVILSQLPKESQQTLGIVLMAEKVKISKEQAEKLLELEKYNSLNADSVRNVLLNANQKDEMVNYKRIAKAFSFPVSYTGSDREKVALIQNLLNEYFEDAEN